MHRSTLAVLGLSLVLPVAFAQQNSSSSLVAPEYLSDGASPYAAPNSGAGVATTTGLRHSEPFSSVALGVKAGILGVGAEAATPLGWRFNLRGGANFFSYADNLSSDGISYNANLHFRSAEASLDWFPMAGGFHISPGALLYNGNQVTASAAVPGGQTFTLNGTTYTSSSTDPVTGSASLSFTKAAPKVTMGWGNLIPRSGRHFSVPVDLGFAYVGDPKVALNLAGTACYTYEGAPYCANVATDPTIQSNVTAQKAKIQKDAQDARFFPLFSLGFAYRF